MPALRDLAYVVGVELIPLTRVQLIKAAGLYNAAFVLLLAAHVLHYLTLIPPWDSYVAGWVVLNILALGVTTFATKTPSPQIMAPLCPYCEAVLRIGTYSCPTHGDLSPERKA